MQKFGGSRAYEKSSSCLAMAKHVKGRINYHSRALRRIVVVAVILGIGRSVEVNGLDLISVGLAQASDKSSAPSVTPNDVRSAKSRLSKPLSMDEERTLKPADSFVECDDCPEMVVVPAGEFMMGSSKGEGDRDEQGPDGKPVRVGIKRTYALGRFAITVAEYLTCVAEGYCPPPVWQETDSPYNAVTGVDSHFRMLGGALTNDRHPIVGVSWGNAQGYVRWMNARLRLRAPNVYRLPSEAEWEWAARGGREGLRYFWGNEFNPNWANASGEFGEDKWAYTSPVGSFPGNAFGLYDMHGNVWQWLEDCYHIGYAGMPDSVQMQGIAWTSSCDAIGTRILRGGSWIDNPRVLRAAERGGSPPNMRTGYVGFRVARTIAPRDLTTRQRKKGVVTGFVGLADQ